MIDSLPEWSSNVLEVYSLKNRSLPYTYWYDFLRSKLDNIPGDILEFGVYRGRTLATTAFCAARASIPRKVYGFDSFSGFPPVYHHNDHPDRFDELFAAGKITGHHYEMIQLNRKYLSVIGRSLSTSSSSSSGNFSSTSVDFVKQKLSFLGIHNVELVEGDIAESVNNFQLPEQISAIFLDADLYSPYHSVLEACWDRLSPGGFIYLDEYFSLKFPGPRIAVDDFLVSATDAQLVCVEAPVNEFERWIVRKS